MSYIQNNLQAGEEIKYKADIMTESVCPMKIGPVVFLLGLPR